MQSKEEFVADGTPYSTVDGHKQTLECAAMWEGSTLVIERCGPQGPCSRLWKLLCSWGQCFKTFLTNCPLTSCGSKPAFLEQVWNSELLLQYQHLLIKAASLFALHLSPARNCFRLRSCRSWLSGKQCSNEFLV